jgi:hypothetical protein
VSKAPFFGTLRRCLTGAPAALFVAVAAILPAAILPAAMAQPAVVPGPAPAAIPPTFQSVFTDALAWPTTPAPSVLNPAGPVTPASNIKINPTSAGTIPNYSATNAQSGLFNNGTGATAGPGLAKALNCATAPSGNNGFTAQECEAINFMRQAPPARPQYTINRNEAFISNNQNAINNPTSVLGAGTNSGTYSACTTTTQTTPAQFRTETCHDFSQLSDNKCIVGRVITVDASHLYQCAEQLQNLSTSTCTVPRELIIGRAFNYECEQSPKQLGTQNCVRNLSVTVVQRPSCALGDVLAQKGMPFGYQFQSGLDLYTDGGVARANCSYLNSPTVEFGLFYGSVLESQYGSGSTNNPPPNINLLPNLVTVTADEVEPADRIIGTVGSATIVVRGGSNCYAGPRTYNCAFTLDLHETPVQVETCNENGCTTGNNCTLNALGLCTPVKQRVVLGFEKPNIAFVETENWDNQCVGLEARL